MISIFLIIYLKIMNNLNCNFKQKMDLLMIIISINNCTKTINYDKVIILMTIM